MTSGHPAGNAPYLNYDDMKQYDAAGNPVGNKHVAASPLQHNNIDRNAEVPNMIAHNKDNTTSARNKEANATGLGNERTIDEHDGTGHQSLFNRIRASDLFQRLLRILQFLSAFISLILFSCRIAKIHRLVHKLSHASGAVEGILAAAVLYTLVVMALKFCSGRGGRPMSSMIIWLLVALDLAFVAAFIAVATLTSPRHGGDSAPCNRSSGHVNSTIYKEIHGKADCNLPWGTFGLAIFST